MIRAKRVQIPCVLECSAAQTGSAGLTHRILEHRQRFPVAPDCAEARAGRGIGGDPECPAAPPDTLSLSGRPTAATLVNARLPFAAPAGRGFGLGFEAVTARVVIAASAADPLPGPFPAGDCVLQTEHTHYHRLTTFDAEPVPCMPQLSLALP
jgi:hypothetical protein